MGSQPPPLKGAQPPQFLAHVYCGQIAGWMKTPLGMEVDLGPGHIVLDWDPAPARERGTAVPLFSANVCFGHGCPSQLLLSCCLWASISKFPQVSLCFLQIRKLDTAWKFLQAKHPSCRSSNTVRALKARFMAIDAFGKLCLKYVCVHLWTETVQWENVLLLVHLTSHFSRWTWVKRFDNLIHWNMKTSSK